MRDEYLTATITTECAHSGNKLIIELDSEMNCLISEESISPLAFAPIVNFEKLKEPSIINSF